LPLLDFHHDLEVLLSSNLSWNAHLDHISSKTYRSLGLLHCILINYHCIEAKKQLYIMLARSHLLYCSQFWNPHLIKDIINIERRQRCSTKFILNDYTLDYKSRLLKLKLLPLIYMLDFSDLLFFAKFIKQPSDNFSILQISFICSNTRSSSNNKLRHIYSPTTQYTTHTL